ncbi:MAG: stage III sporulation protein AA [Lachnospiraceae bacterium]|nr:stage III sporulation protein AA [Lachnospiraceae bacterium]
MGQGVAILGLFPERIRKILQVKVKQSDSLEEIRLRVGQPVRIKQGEKELVLQEEQKLGMRDLTETLNGFCKDSPYAFAEELQQGFLTMPGGHWVGICGQVILDDQMHIRNIKHVSYLNIRIAHQVPGCADPLLPYCFQNDVFQNTLIISPPGAGKTTILRDLIRQVSDGSRDHPGLNVSVVDERSELAGAFMGVPQNDMGKRTDVLDGCPKALGMLLLLRAMSPELIAVDELGTEADAEAMLRVLNCGCKILCTIHGDDMDSIKEKQFLHKLWENRAFDRFVILARKEKQHVIKGIYDGDGICLKE